MKVLCFFKLDSITRDSLTVDIYVCVQRLSTDIVTIYRSATYFHANFCFVE